jgi:hypothetical protein
LKAGINLTDPSIFNPQPCTGSGISGVYGIYDTHRGEQVAEKGDFGRDTTFVETMARNSGRAGIVS